MRKAILSLVGTAALLSIVSSSLALESRVVVGRKVVVERGRKRGVFTQLEASQKGEIEECMAEDLARVVNKSSKDILGQFSLGKTVDTIIKENGLTLETAQTKLDQLHKEKLRMKLKMCTDEQSISLVKIEEIYKKIT